MFELFHWKEKEIRAIKRDLEELFIKLMSSYGLEMQARFVEIRHEHRFYNDHESLLLEVSLPDVEPQTIRVILEMDTIIITALRNNPYLGYSGLRRRIKLPFAPKEDQVMVNFKEGMLKIIAFRPLKKSVKLQIVQE